MLPDKTKLTGDDKDDGFVGELFELHAFTGRLILVIKQKLEDVVGALTGLFQSDTMRGLVINVLAESLVVVHNSEEQEWCKTPLLNLGLRSQLYRESVNLLKCDLEAHTMTWLCW